MKKLAINYINTFKGLSNEVWWLSLITLINRAGTMVIPFMSLYLTESLQFSLSQVGWVMSCFGLGSVIGAWLGGKLTDTIGYYKVMVFSLIATGVLFGLLQFVKTFEVFCGAIFILMIVADVFRPASFVALSSYSKPENRTRSVTLIRLAINLGFSAGPAVGGIIITKLSYNGLFWVDAITCMSAGLLLLFVLHPKKAKITQEEKVVENPISPFKDSVYVLLLVVLLLFGLAFLQYFSTMPLYYRDIHKLTEFNIGLLLGFNGFFIFIFEMPLVKFLEDKKFSKVTLMIYGCVLLLMSFVVLNLTSWVGILIIGMVLMSLGEMIFFPFSNAFAIERSKQGKQGAYMALYAAAFSVAHIFAHNSGMQMVSKVGFDTTWNVTMLVCIVGLVFLILLRKRLLHKTTK